MRGPPPKPTKLKILQGNPGKRPLNTSEPQPKRGRPRCPPWLDAEAKAKWKQLVPELDRLGLLTVVDGDALAAYCQAWAEFRESTETLRKSGRVARTGGMRDETTGEWVGGQLQPHPAVAQQRSALTAIRAFAALFGLNPASRSKLSAPVKPADEMEEFLAQSGG